MKAIQKIGFGLFLVGLSVFVSLIFIGDYNVTSSGFDQFLKNKGIKSELFINNMKETVVGKEFTSPFEFSSNTTSAVSETNESHKKNSEWDKVIWDKPHSFSYQLAKEFGSGSVHENKMLFWWLTFGLGIIGALLFIIPNVILLGPKGIKNNGIYQSSATNRGWLGWLVFVF